MIRNKPAVDVPCGVCGEMIREWVEYGTDDDDLMIESCGHTLADNFHAWAACLQQKKIEHERRNL